MSRLQIDFQGTSTIIRIKGKKTTVGRSGRCTISLPDATLAETHFRIEERTRGYRLKDDGSGSGTLVNGKPVYATTLHHGDVIEAGGLRCTFLDENAPAPPPQRAPAEPVVYEAPVEEVRGRVREPVAPKVIWGVGLGLVLLLGALFLLNRGSAEEAANLLVRQANKKIHQSSLEPDEALVHLREARDLLERVLSEYDSTNSAATSSLILTKVRRALDDLQAVAAEEKGLAGVTDPGLIDAAYARLARMRKGAHAVVIRRIDHLKSTLERQLSGRTDAAIGRAEQDVATLLTAKHYGEALRVWQTLRTDDYAFRERASRGVREVGRAAAGAYRGLLDALGRTKGLDAQIALLEAQRQVFSGTMHADELEVRIAGLRARRTGVTPLPTTPTGNKPTPVEPPAVVEKGPYVDPPVVAGLVKERRFGAAAAKLHRLSRHPLAPVRVEELTRLANLMSELVALISANPDSFTRIRVRTGAYRDLAGADADGIKAKQDGATVDFAWPALPANACPRMLRLAGLTDPPRLATALLFDDVGLAKEADKAYVAFFKSGQDVAFLTRALARRRGIDPPKEGFVLFRNRLATRSERDRVLLDERIVKLGRNAHSTDDRRRKAALEELESLGEPALETYAKALRDRRALLAGELRGHRAFSRERAVAVFLRELPPRRKHALAFIRDARAYPYPKKTPEAQKEVEDRVDRVREIFETPAQFLLKKSQQAQTLYQEIQDVDSQLEILATGDEPVLDKLMTEIAAKLDMKHIALGGRDQGRIEYNDAVTKYNAELEGTTVETEERACVKAVNDYRWMMGLRAVKIDERLVRAARKHSIEMAQDNYFTHNSKTPRLRTPGLRARREGYGGGVAENIARGPATGVGAFKGWFGSSGHHRNMCNAGHRDIGVGAHMNHWWTQKFGRATGNSLKPPNVPPDPDPPGTSGNGKPPPKVTPPGGDTPQDVE